MTGRKCRRAGRPIAGASRRVGLLLCLLLPLLLAAAAGAQVLQAGDPGGFVALPVLTSGEQPGQRSTVATISNLSVFETRVLHLNWIDGDTCTTLDFDCRLDPFQTTQFVFQAVGPGQLRVDYACSSGLWGTEPFVRLLSGSDGLFVATPEALVPGTGDKTVRQNDLFATAQVFDSATGLSFGVQGIHAQALPGPLGDRVYRFEGAELAFWPDALGSDYAAPDAFARTQLLLFTVDFRISAPPVVARVNGFATGDDGQTTSAGITLDCFDELDLDDAPNGFGGNVRGDGSGTRRGTFVLNPEVVVRQDSHELAPLAGDGNGVRRPSVHGWKVEWIGDGRLLPDFNLPMGSAGFTPSSVRGETLNDSDTPLTPLGLDVNALDAR